MTTTLTELRARVRQQTQTTSAELTDDAIDRWLQEAYNRTVAVETEWPHFEYTWILTLPIGDWIVDLPTAPAPQIPGTVSLRPSVGAPLELVTSEWAEQFFANNPVAVGGPNFFSIWGGQIMFWPHPNSDTEQFYIMRGHRMPEDWIADGASAVPDCDARLHAALANFATALAYAQQEDMEMERNYMERWQKDVEKAIQIILRPARNRPIAMGPRFITPIGRGVW